MTNFIHTPVLKDEAMDYLQIKPGEHYIDATLGGGGHTGAILERGGLELGIDQDSEALSYINENFKFEILNFKLKTVWGNFRNIKQIAEENSFTNVSGVLFDLGVSSYQLDSDNRGFSIKKNTPLDMRMDANSGITAKDIVNRYSKEELEDIFLRFGEESQAESAAEAIVAARKTKEIGTTGELVSTLALVLKNQGTVHPATKIFQALRIEVNSELESLKKGLEGAQKLAKPGGRIVVISFHSLEDRITKRYFSDWEHKGLGRIITKKPITASPDEVRSNPRARSAKMRVFEKGEGLYR